MDNINKIIAEESLSYNNKRGKINKVLKNTLNNNSVKNGTGWTTWCPSKCKANKYNGDYPVDDTQQPLVLLKPNYYEIEYIPNSNKTEQDRISLHIRDNDPYTAIPPSAPNGGLYGGPQSNRPWASIPVVPTTANMINQNLLSANPPPGANVQYPGSNRLGNNYQAMPGVYWYNPDGMNGQFAIKGT